MTATYDTIIIGTGAGGLQSGLSLARRGRDVLLLEAGKQFGGMLNPFSRRRYHFDVGIHYLGEAGPDQAMRRILDEVGLESVKFREINPDCIDRYVFDGYESKLVKGFDRWGDLLVKDFPHEEKNIRSFLKMMEAVSGVTSMSVAGPSVKKILAGLRHAPDLVRLLRSPFSTVLDHYFDDPLLRNVFAGPGGDLGLPPSRASGLMSILVLCHYLGGAYYPVGGSGAIRDAMVDQLVAHGASLQRNQEVTKIEVLGPHRFAVYTRREQRYEARSVISNVDVKLTVEMIRGATPSRRTRKKAADLRPSLGSFCVFLATDIDLTQTEVTDANIWHYGTNDIDGAYEAALTGQMPDEPIFFLTAPTLKDPDSQRAPEGHHTVELITLLPPEPFKDWWSSPTTKRGEEYDALKQEISDRIVAGAERYIPGLRDHLLIEESATPATVWHYVKGREGGIYGPEMSPEQTGLSRFSPGIGIPGLFLTGASVLGGGVLPCLVSGNMAARLCHQHLKERRAQWPLSLLRPRPRPA